MLVTHQGPSPLVPRPSNDFIYNHRHLYMNPIHSASRSLRKYGHILPDLQECLEVLRKEKTTKVLGAQPLITYDNGV